MRFAVVLSAVVLLGHAASTAAQLSVVPLGMDDFANPESIHRTIVEPAAYGVGRMIVAAFQVGRVPDGGASDIGFAASTNGGRSWTQGLLPGTTAHVSPTGPYYSVSDPSVAYDPRHRVWLIAALGIVANDETDVLVARSTDRGLTWSAPVVADGSGTASGVINDKTWITCDGSRRSPFYGRCYIQYTNFTRGGRNQMIVSTDGGATWSAPAGSPSNAQGQGGQPVTQRDGTVVVPFVSIFGDAIRSFRSTDGGATWSNPVTVTPLAYHGAAGHLRAPSVTSASAGVDATGTVYLVWPDCARHEPGCTANDVFLSTSADGQSWSAPVALPLDGAIGGADHFILGLAVDRGSRGARARLALTFYDYPDPACDADTCALNAAFVSSRNGGATWSDAIQLAGPMSLPWLPLTTGGYMVGDYVATAIGHRAAFPVFVAASPPAGGELDEVVYTTARGIALRGGDRPVIVP